MPWGTLAAWAECLPNSMPETRPMAVPALHNLSPEKCPCTASSSQKGTLRDAFRRGQRRTCARGSCKTPPPQLSPAMAETIVSLISELVLKGCCLRREMEMKQTQGV